MGFVNRDFVFFLVIAWLLVLVLVACIQKTFASQRNSIQMDGALVFGTSALALFGLGQLTFLNFCQYA
jgi:hypothetical protein